MSSLRTFLFRISVVALYVLTAYTFGVAQSSALPAKADQVHPLLIGSSLPQVTLTTIDDKPVSIQSLINSKPTVVIVYRGGWCPFCNMHLAAVGEAEAEIAKLGYHIVAISPDAPSRLQESRTQKKLGYTLVSDARGDFSKQAGIAFQVPKNYEKLVSESSGGINTDFLPVPSVFIVDSKGVVRFTYVNPDFKHRISKEMLLSVARTLRSEKL